MCFKTTELSRDPHCHDCHCQEIRPFFCEIHVVKIVVQAEKMGFFTFNFCTFWPCCGSKMTSSFISVLWLKLVHRIEV